MSSLLRVVLAEDHVLMQGALGSLLSGFCEVVGTVDQGDLVLRTIRHRNADGLVLDISMPGRSGLQLLPELRSALPELAIVVTSNHESALYRREAMLRGADAYVAKCRATTDLWPALQNALLRRCTTRLPVMAASGRS